MPLALRGPTSASGSNSDVGGRNREVRFTPESRLNSDIAACPFGANNGSRAQRAPHLVNVQIEHIELFQRKWLVAEHAFGNDAASHHGIKRMLRDEVVAFSGDLFGILHQLELFVAVVVVQPHALADDFENIDDPK
jgi:hypothetical protein